MKKHIVIEYEVESKTEFLPDSVIKERLKEIYEESIKEYGCSEVKIEISTIK